jgi:hypothetical protein
MADKIEAAASGRAKCRACRQTILKGELRFGEGVENPYGEGEAIFWYHLRCAALRRGEKLKPVLGEYGELVPERGEVERILQLSVDNPKLEAVVGAGFAPTGRARCQQCRKPIAKGELRLVLERMDEGMSSSAGFLHAACGAAHLGQAGLLARLKYCATNLSADEFDELRRTVESTSD